MTILALGVLAILIPLTTFDILAKPTIRRLGLRNVVRRKNEAVLVVVGSMLATALIVASFVVGNSFRTSIRSLGESLYGPVDEIVTVDDPESAAEKLLPEISKNDSPIDGLLVSLTSSVAVENSGGSVEPELRLLEVDLKSAKAFGNDPDATGLASLPNKLGPNKVAVNEQTAEKLGLAVGDSIQVYFGPNPVSAKVVAITPAVGLSGFGNVIADPGTITSSVTDPSIFSEHELLVSNTGGVYAGAELTEEASKLIQSKLGKNEIEISRVKQELLDDADAEASETTELFGTIGGFSVAAGILLLVNLFVMLAAERKVELGTLRSLGLTKSQLRRSFTIEGLIYGVLSTMLGTVAGIGVAAAVMTFVGQTVDSDSDIIVGLSVSPEALLSGAAIGLAISLLTVLVTSMRLVRLNPALALKDASEPKRTFSKRLQLVAGATAIIIGALLYLTLGDTAIVAMIAPIICAVGLIIPLKFILNNRLAIIIGCLLGIGWAVSVFGLLDETMNDPDISLFLIQGLVLVGLGVTILSTLNKVFGKLVSKISGSYSSKLGMAYPLARPVRSSLLISMYALVIFTLTFMAVMNSVFGSAGPELANKAGGQADLIVESKPITPISSQDINEIDGVANITSTERVLVSFLAPNEAANSEPEPDAATIIDISFSEIALPTISRATEFKDDTAMWNAVSKSNDLVVVPAYYELEPGEKILLTTELGNPKEAKIAGVLEMTWTIGSGIHMSAAMVDSIEVFEKFSDRQYVQLNKSSDIEPFVEQVKETFATNGVQAESFQAIAKSEIEGQEVFLNILQGYLALGLLIGFAGLGVVQIRAVRERRQQLGMMRAVGIKASVTRNAFLTEAGFIGFQGVFLGIGLGVLSSWQILTQSSAFEEGLTFSMPYGRLGMLALLAFAASLLAGLIPAIRAGRTTPAAALRMAG